MLKMRPLTDVAYSFNHGALVRKQWKDMVLAGSFILTFYTWFQINHLLFLGSYKPSPYTGVKKCKWANCSDIFEDAVDALKHIKDKHLKDKKRKSSSNLMNALKKARAT